MTIKILIKYLVWLLIGVVFGMAIFYFIFSLEPDKINIYLTDNDRADHILDYDHPLYFYDHDFFTTIRNQLITEKTSFIEVNLSTNQLFFYDNGKQLKEFEVLAQGRPGSLWETPAGLYRVEAKISNHFSSITRVYMPWSIHFHGNFFIHGWPYLPGGQPVSSSYSGGCIRLTTADAEELYQLVDKGMPVLIHRQSDTETTQEYILTPRLSAKSFLVVDLANKFVFFEKNSDKIYPVFELPYLLAAAVAWEYFNISTDFIVSAEALDSIETKRLTSGDRVSVYDLIFPLLMETEIEAAQALAWRRGEELFIDRLNRKAASLGMKTSRFYPFTQLDKNKASARDLFSLAYYIQNNRQLIWSVSSMETLADLNPIYSRPQWKDLKNINSWSADSRFVGGLRTETKNGYEAAVMIFRLEIDNQEREVVLIILDSMSLDKDIEKILQAITAGGYSLLDKN
ncbi:MAG: L,D-transpeptidase family protein [Patescibacteria group bacterium]